MIEDCLQATSSASQLEARRTLSSKNELGPRLLSTIIFLTHAARCMLGVWVLSCFVNVLGKALNDRFINPRTGYLNKDTFLLERNPECTCCLVLLCFCVSRRFGLCFWSKTKRWYQEGKIVGPLL